MSEARRRRREQARRDAKTNRQPVLIAGEGIVAAELPGHRYEARPHADLPPKIPGKHRWIASGAWVLTDAFVQGANDPDLLKFLDHENLMHLAIGCYDCERPLGAITFESSCPSAGDSD